MKISLNSMLKPSKPSTTKRKDLKATLTDLLLKPKDSPKKLMSSLNALELNPLSLKPPAISSKETNNFGTKLKPFAEPLIPNITMPLKPEDKNSNLLLNSKRWLNKDSLKLMTKTLKEELISKTLLNSDFIWIHHKI